MYVQSYVAMYIPKLLAFGHKGIVFNISCIYVLCIVISGRSILIASGCIIDKNKNICPIRIVSYAFSIPFFINSDHEKVWSYFLKLNSVTLSAIFCFSTLSNTQYQLYWCVVTKAYIAT